MPTLHPRTAQHGYNRIPVGLTRPALLCILALVALTGCASSARMAEKQMNRGEYDAAIATSLRKLERKPASTEAAAVLTASFERAKERDERRVEFLMLEGREANWPEILRLYEQLDRRQEKVRRAPGDVWDGDAFESYAERLVEARRRSADFSFGEGCRLLESGLREDARTAAGHFEEALRIRPESSAAAEGLRDARDAGRTHVLLSFSNESDQILPERSVAELQEIPLREIGSEWAEFHLDEDDGTLYDYLVVARLTQVPFSPERVDRDRFTQSAEIVESRREVVDSTGATRRIEEKRTVTADVTTLTLTKQVLVAMRYEIRELASGRLVKAWDRPLSADFEDRSMVYEGDLEAVPSEWRDLAGKKPRPFPSDEDLLAQAVSILKTDFVRSLRAEQSVFEQIPRESR